MSHIHLRFLWKDSESGIANFKLKFIFIYRESKKKSFNDLSLCRGMNNCPLNYGLGVKTYTERVLF